MSGYASENQLDYTLIEYVWKGDANLDSALNVNDVTDIQRCVAKLDFFTEKQRGIADMNGDGVVNIIDATAVQREIASIIIV